MKLRFAKSASEYQICDYTMMVFMCSIGYSKEVATEPSYPLNTGLKLNVPAGIYLLKVNKRNITKRCEICSKLTIKTPALRQWRRSGVFIVSF